ncbi:glycosyltransferase family 9 protein [Shewanella glacialimarina]|jgi:spore coat polysaccharide biosynthesis predicted glycosyltransferase SpsG|uniref:hypothetical protein n=1 Tax=Shewanella glacialimarina TaxID=2590884 RepID=UPI001CF86C64|nr:hypothetical protein [Shewanella glacialimarina]UCX06388.1 hypothetical protein FJ709_18910 [Shewanella glacialimarina]
MAKAHVILFVPVSSEEGIGEYMRSKIVADEIAARWPDAQIEFVLNSRAPYASSCPYVTHLVDDTPTKRVKEVNLLVDNLKPDLVIFDAAGRKAQLKHAHKSGAKVVFVSQHRRKRSRGMKIERALVTDSHWVVQPEFVIGDITRFDKFKLNLIKRPFPIFTGSIFAKPDPLRLQVLQQYYGITSGQYLLYSAGSGGHRIGDSLAADIFAQTASNLFKLTGIPSLMIFGPNYPKELADMEGIIVIPELTSLDFISLLSDAQAAVLSGGDTLLQAIALNVPTLAVAVAKDQPSRIERCTQHQLALSCDTNVVDMTNTVQLLLTPLNGQKLINAMQLESDAEGLDICMAEVTRLLGEVI